MKAKTVICLMLVAGALGGILLLLTLSPLEDETLCELRYVSSMLANVY